MKTIFTDELQPGQPTSAEEQLHAELLRVLEYNPWTGIWSWKICLSSRRKSGEAAGTISYGKLPRRMIYFNKKRYLASRLAVFYMTGEWPKQTVDHINRDTLDDRWVNLRDVSYSEQNYNRRSYTRRYRA